MNYHAGSLSTFRKHLAESIEALLERAPSGAQVVRYVIGTAALFDFATAEETRRVCAGILSERQTCLLGDGLVALFGAHRGEPGVLVSAGTGSIAISLDATGHFFTQGGFGPLIGGDPGSAFWIASQSVLAAARMECEAGRLTLLGKAIRDYFQIDHLHAIIPQIYGSGDGSRRLAGLAGFLAELPLARKAPLAGIQKLAGVALATMVAPLLSQFGGSSVAICAAGSVLARNRCVRRALAEELQRLTGRPVPVRSPKFSAAAGAVLLGLRQAGATIGPDVLEELSSTAK